MEERPWRVVYEVPCPEVALGPHRFDTRYRALVVGSLHRNPDTERDAFLANAEQLVADGADVLEVGGVDAGPGPGPERTEPQELEQVVPAVEAVRARFGVPI